MSNRNQKKLSSLSEDESFKLLLRGTTTIRQYLHTDLLRFR